jgi:hypothetical protein
LPGKLPLLEKGCDPILAFPAFNRAEKARIPDFKFQIQIPEKYIISTSALIKGTQSIRSGTKSLKPK